MFDEVSQLAEKLATGISRRSFVGSIGRWAGATALGLAGVLSTARPARAGPTKTCCVYRSGNPFAPTYSYDCINGPGPCPGAPFASGRVFQCKDCHGGGGHLQ